MGGDRGVDGAMGLRSFGASVGVLGVEEEGVHVNSAAVCSVSDDEEIELNTDDNDENADVLSEEALSKILAIFSTLIVAAVVVVVVVPLLRFVSPDCRR